MPSVYQSSGTERRGHITKQGNALLRSMLIQNARVAVRHSEYFKNKYEKLLANGVKEKKAIVAIARHMVVIMYIMLVRNEKYVEERKGEKPARKHGL